MSRKANQCLQRTEAVFSGVKNYGSTEDPFFQPNSPTLSVWQAVHLALRWSRRCQDKQGRALTASDRKNSALAFQNGKCQNERLLKTLWRLKAGYHQLERRPIRLPEELMELVQKNECDFQRAISVPDGRAAPPGRAGSTV